MTNEGVGSPIENQCGLRRQTCRFRLYLTYVWILKPVPVSVQ